MRVAFFLMFCALSACAATDTTGQVTRQQATDDFSFAVQKIMPLATEICGARRADSACDFDIVVDDREARAPNAFQSVGADGQPVLTFTASLIAQAQNPDELALIVAHEAAHHIGGHLGQLNQDVARLKSLNAVTDMEAIDQGWIAVQIKLRRFELDADTLGAEIAFAAGFDPEKAAHIIARLPSPPDHASASHPDQKDRLSAVLAATR